jgi:hypothetical protein
LKIQSIICMALILAMLTGPAWAGCGRWVIRDNTDFLADPLFDEAVASSTGANATVSSDGTQATENQNAEQNEESASSGKAPVQEKAPVIDLAGKWRISMADGQGEGTGKTMEIILIQSGDRLQGYGTILEDGSEVTATATGAISQDEISLEIKANPQKKDYRLDLVEADSQLQGRYELYEADKLAESGNATASRSGS